MKYCTQCGKEVHDNANVCLHCGCGIQTPVTQSNNSTLAFAIKVFMVLSCIAKGLMVIPLVWCIPMTIYVFDSLKRGTPIGLGIKICTLLFVSPIAGICMLCMNERE